jgi:anti-sigma-K factor RskA
MGTEHIAELLPDYALGCIDAEDSARVYQHLQECPGCQAELEAYDAVVQQLALAACDAAPPPELKDRLMMCIKERQTASETPQPWWRMPLDALTHLKAGALAWQAAMIVLIVGLAIGNIWQWQHSDRSNQVETGRLPSVAMVSTTAAPQAKGMLVLSADGQYGPLIVDGLPVLDSRHQYQLWLIRGAQRTSGAVFSVDADGYGSLAVSAPQPLSSYDAFGITVEPAGGSPGPTGERVLFANM